MNDKLSIEVNLKTAGGGNSILNQNIKMNNLHGKALENLQPLNPNPASSKIRFAAKVVDKNELPRIARGRHSIQDGVTNEYSSGLFP